MYYKNIIIAGKNKGYYYFIDYEHPLSTGNSGRVYYHRHVMSIKLNRWISTEEQVNHINGIKTDNDPINLEILSASEHTKKDALRLGKQLKYIDKCLICNCDFYRYKNSKGFCSDICATIKTRKTNFTYEELKELVWKYPIVKIASLYNCSDKSIHNACKRLGVTKPPHGYWLQK